MRIFTYILIVISLLIGTFAHAQVSWNFAQQNLEPFIMNPSAAGLKPCISLAVAHRRNYTTLPEQIFTNSISFNASTQKDGVHKFKKGWHGYGATILDDQIGIFRNFTLSGAYAYHLVLSDKKYLSFGTFVSISRMSVNIDRVRIKNQTDPAFTNTAPIYFAPIFSPGISYASPSFYAGLSISNMNKRTADMYGNSWGTPADLKTMIYGNAMKTYLLNDYYKLIASIQLFYEGQLPPSFDFQGGISFQDQVTGFIGYRIQDAAIGALQVRVKNKLKIGYAYEYNLSRSGSFAQHTHEIMISFNSCFTDNGFDPRRYCPAYAKHQVSN